MLTYIATQSHTFATQTYILPHKPSYCHTCSHIVTQSHIFSYKLTYCHTNLHIHIATQVNTLPLTLITTQTHIMPQMLTYCHTNAHIATPAHILPHKLTYCHANLHFATKAHIHCITTLGHILPYVSIIEDCLETLWSHGLCFYSHVVGHMCALSTKVYYIVWCYVILHYYVYDAV